MIVKCNWKTCKSYKEGICKAETIELKSFSYEDNNEELEALRCSSYQYDSFWMCNKGREVYRNNIKRLLMESEEING